jgi:hypothetical protein
MMISLATPTFFVQPKSDRKRRISEEIKTRYLYFESMTN